MNASPDSLLLGPVPVTAKSDIDSSSLGIVKSWRRPASAMNRPIMLTTSDIDQGLLSRSLADQIRQTSVLGLGNRAANCSLVKELRSDESRCNYDGLILPTTPVSNTFPRHPMRETAGEVQHHHDRVQKLSRDLHQNRDHSLIGNAKLDPEPKAKVPRRKPKQADERLRNLIEKRLKREHGVLLGGELLWDSILATWDQEYPGEIVPHRDEFRSTLRILLEEGIITEHWHAFRDSTGSFSKCQLLTSPGVDAFSTESLQLLEKVKTLRLESTTRPVTGSYGSTNSSTELQVGGRGRRLLANEVALLHAPVYVAQIAAKKERGSDTRDRAKRSKQSEARDGVEEIASFPSKRRKVIQSQAPAALHEKLHSETQEVAPALKILFLSPNTFLEEEPDIDYLISVRSPSPQTASYETIAESQAWAESLEAEEYLNTVTVLTDEDGIWPWLDTQFFECHDGSFTVRGWMPAPQWFQWESFSQMVDRRHAQLHTEKANNDDALASSEQFFDCRIRACLESEMAWGSTFTNTPFASAGPHHIFLRFCSGPIESEALHLCEISWPPEEQHTPTSYGRALLGTGQDLPATPENGKLDTGIASHASSTLRIKRVALATRSLTSLEGLQCNSVNRDDIEFENYPMDIPDKLLAAFIAVRTLLGGADKTIDWGLLMIIFPDADLMQLRRFWVDTRKRQGPCIANFTRAFQERVVTAFKHDELPMIDFNNPQDYDWDNLVRWTMGIPRLEGFQIPASRKLLDRHFSLEDVKGPTDDWRERFFHVQASVFTRFEAVTSTPGAFPVDRDLRKLQRSFKITKLDIARSWIKSLCSMSIGKYSVEDIRDKFFTLLPGNKRKTSELFKEAIELLAKQRVICRSKKPPLGGRPYRLSEGYMSALSKMAQSSKYRDAAAFKMRLDATFRLGKKLTVPYTLNDGAMMALTNLNAAGRIRLMPTNLPNIPLGFEPGNYESRKYPKSYYHFGIEAMPTDVYLYNEQIHVLKAVVDAGPPSDSQDGELPQWVDIFSKPNKARWRDILGAVCFAMATRGSMDIEGICSALCPILDDFEASLIVTWGKKTGVLTDLPNGTGSAVGEWWWLVVPWL